MVNGILSLLICIGALLMANGFIVGFMEYETRPYTWASLIFQIGAHIVLNVAIIRSFWPVKRRR